MQGCVNLISLKVNRVLPVIAHLSTDYLPVGYACSVTGVIGMRLGRFPRVGAEHCGSVTL